MKLLYIFPLLLIVSLMPVVYGETIELTTDKTTYTSEDDFVVVSGKLDKFSESNFTYIQLFPPNDSNYLRAIDANLDNNANFSVKFSISELEVSGTYTIASSDQSDGTNQFTTFEFVNDRPEAIINPEDIESFNPIAELEKRVNALTTQNLDLTIENQDLKNQIKSLNDRLDNLMSVIMEQINVMMAFFQ